MSRTTVVTGIVVAVAIAGAIYLNRRSTDDAPPRTDAAAQQASLPKEGVRTDSTPAASAVAQLSSAPVRPAPDDPRLVALQVSTDNGLIEFIKDANGKVIQEIDQDAGSLGFRKPLREYMYAGDKMIGVTSYQYFPDHVQVNTTAVSYKPDGSVDQLIESTTYDSGARNGAPGR
ncbi:MAG TPA: hypothetical protein PKE27_17585 [Povalibacter sp.]|uniref:hypothetical protein n=1 Tax=Povalibacter sp. TaxID=1962978 RepID=UPI002B549525|nr:hypothetical protein [Povalibacter sp.]HMN46395.1 hypothetical protein [Povalibacter sp.]